MYMNAQNMWQRLECLRRYECLGKDVKINVSDWNTSLVTFIIVTVSVYSKAVVLLYHSILKPPNLLLSRSCNSHLYLLLFTD